MNKKYIATICCFFILCILIISSIVIAKDNGNGKPDLCDKFEEKKNKWEDKWENKEVEEKDWGDKWDIKREKKIEKLDILKDKFCDECDDNNGGDNGNGDNGNGDDGNGGDSNIIFTTSSRKGNIPPVADVSAGEPYIGFSNENMEFNGSLSYDPDGYIVEFIWEFIDGTTKEGEIVFHSFNIKGDYEVKLTVFDNEGASNSTIAYISVIKPNIPPTTPSIYGPIFGKINTEYDFSVISYDFDDDNLIYYVDWGDGLISESLYIPNGTEMVFKYSWDSTGDYIITVKSFDGITYSETSEFHIQIGINLASTISDILLFIITILILISIFLIINHGRKEKPKRIIN